MHKGSRNVCYMLYKIMMWLAKIKVLGIFVVCSVSMAGKSFRGHASENLVTYLRRAYSTTKITQGKDAIINS